MADVTTEHPDYEYMEARHELPETLLMGTAAMRRKGTQFLPQHSKEKDTHYNERLATAVLWGFFEDAVEGLTAKPFAQPVTLSEGTHPLVKEWAEDVDNQGQDLTGFARALFRQALATGIAHILVEFPAGGVPMQTVAAREQARTRPWWVLLKAGDLTQWRTEWVNGKPYLTRLVRKETTVAPDGDWDFKEVEQWRMIQTVPEPLWQLWERDSAGGALTLVDEGVYGSSTIKLVTLYFNRERYMVGVPPLDQVAQLELDFWQSYSDQKIATMMHRFPIALGSGMSRADEIEWGPRVLLTSTEPNARLSFVEHGGVALEAGRVSLKDIEARIKAITASTLSNRPGDVKATAIAIDTASVKSIVASWARATELVVEQAFRLSLEWVGVGPDAEVDVTINSEFGSPGEDRDLDLLQRQSMVGQLSLETLLNEEKRRGTLDDRLNIQEEMRRIEDAAAIEPAPMTVPNSVEQIDGQTQQAQAQGRQGRGG